ncbi:disintegrin and metalloproteinase domain-containing protein 32-like [Sylvia borin]
MHKDAVSYILRIEGRPYTIHLQQHTFLSDDFQIYISSEQGSLHSGSAHIEGGCHYWGYIDGFPSSAVTLNTCSGLRGLLQFENVSYGIQPLGYPPASQHVLYRVSEEQKAAAPPAQSPPEGELAAWEVLDKAQEDDEPLSAAAQSPKYLTVYVVLDKALYNYMGSDPNTVTEKIIQAFNLINNYHGNVTLESFSVLLAQVLAHSLGMSSDGSRGCSCPGRVCIMSPEALHFSGAKAFSNCSIRDFETFLKQGRGVCLFSSPRLSRRSGAVCGNRVVEPGEQCDCGTAQLMKRNTVCRPATDAQCDLPEVCSGSSATCPPDEYVQDGQDCGQGTGYCYHGRCQSSELHCKRIYGRDSRNAPVVCYEEINGQRDRFGHCGFRNKHKYSMCAWRNWLSRDLRCGKLVCTYPSLKPFSSGTAAVIYARVRQHLCVSLNYLHVAAWLDPLLVPPGTKCGSGRVCINNTCHPLSVLGSKCDSKANCHGHGVCNNKGSCYCYSGWQPPDCGRRASRRWRRKMTAAGLQRALDDGEMAWLVLGSSFILLVLTAALGLVLWRQQVLGQCRREQPPGAEGTSQNMDRELEPDLEQNLEADPEVAPELQIDVKLEMKTDTDPTPEPALEEHRGC